jgi:hypothetical protein
MNDPINISRLGIPACKLGCLDSNKSYRKVHSKIISHSPYLMACLQQHGSNENCNDSGKSILDSNSSGITVESHWWRAGGVGTTSTTTRLASMHGSGGSSDVS